MVELIAEHGEEPLHAPALAEVADIDQAYIAKLVGELQARPPNIAIFQTGVGTQALCKATDALGLTDKLLVLLARATVVVRGPEPTAQRCARACVADRSRRRRPVHDKLKCWRRCKRTRSTARA